MIAQAQFTIVDLNDITTQSTAPSNPTVNMLWLDTANDVLKRWNGSEWVVNEGGLSSFIDGQYSQDIASLEGKIDNLQEIWFYAGAPTLSNPPVSTWDISDYAKHVGDMYYDTETGYAYRFKSDSGVFSWEQVQDQDVIESLAIANAASDTADSKRRVFLATPVPPYDNGDLWINNQEVYVCQISKPDTETYADGDFIPALKYTDDTRAEQVANELTVVQGQVTQVITDNDELKVKFTQTDSLVNKVTNEVADEIDKREAMIRLGHENGIPVVELGTTESPVKTKYKNDGMYIEEAGQVTSYFKNGKAYNKDMEILNSLIIGNFAFVKRDNGNTSLVYIGGAD